MKKRSIVNFIFLSLVILLLSLSLPTTSSIIAKAEKAKINKKNITLVVGQKYKLKISSTKMNIKWKSKNTYTATVSKKGIVTAKNEGKAKIVAQVGNKKYQCAVKVEAPYIGTTEGGESYIEVGESIKFYMCCTSYTGYKWKSSNNRIATVTNDGVVTGFAPGDATIYTKIRGKKKKKVIHVTERTIKNLVSIQRKAHSTTFCIRNKGDKILKIRTYGYIFASIKSVRMYCHDFDEGPNNYEFITIYPGEEKTLSYSSHNAGYLGTISSYSLYFYYGGELHFYDSERGVH